MTVIELPFVFSYRASGDQVWIDPMTNDDTFNQFFLKHYDGLVGSLTVITGDRDRADDCVQEAFIRAFARWRRVSRYDNPATWVRRVAINLSKDVIRSETRRRRREDSNHLPSDSSTPSPEHGVTADLDLIRLLGQLSPQQRRVAALFYVEDLAISEIAKSLGVTAGAVKFHLNKARSALKSILEAEAEHSVRSL